MFKFKPKRAYFSVHALRDGTICFAFPTRKPRKTKHQKPDIDEDGIHNWYVDDEAPENMTDWAKGVHQGAIVNVLNFKRILRQQVESKLDDVLQRLAQVEERLIEIGDRVAQDVGRSLIRYSTERLSSGNSFQPVFIPHKDVDVCDDVGVVGNGGRMVMDSAQLRTLSRIHSGGVANPLSN